MITTLKRVAIGLALIVLPVAWIWTMQERPNEPPPGPPPPKNMKATAPTHPAIPGREVVIETSKGKIVGVLYERDAKITARNFMELVQRKFYDGLVFHRVEPGLVVQTGDPTGTGTGGSGKKIRLETTSVLNYDSEGMLGMARTSDPNSATSQFFINLRPYPAWNNSYAVFGKVVSGMDVVRKLVVGDKVKKAYLLPPDKPAVPLRIGT